MRGGWVGASCLSPCGGGVGIMWHTRPMFFSQPLPPPPPPAPPPSHSPHPLSLRIIVETSPCGCLLFSTPSPVRYEPSSETQTATSPSFKSWGSFSVKKWSKQRTSRPLLISCPERSGINSISPSRHAGRPSSGKLSDLFCLLTTEEIPFVCRMLANRSSIESVRATLGVTGPERASNCNV